MAKEEALWASLVQQKLNVKREKSLHLFLLEADNHNGMEYITKEAAIRTCFKRGLLMWVLLGAHIDILQFIKSANIAVFSTSL